MTTHPPTTVPLLPPVAADRAGRPGPGPGAPGSVGVLCPFDENAVHALACTAHDAGRLVVRAVPQRDPSRWVGGGWPDALPAGIPPGRHVRRARERAARAALPEDLVVGALPEVMRIAGARFRSPLSSWVGSYLWRAAFDRACAAADLPPADVLIGMPGACLASFTRHDGGLRVLHEVDAHPRAHNDALVSAYGAAAAAAELYPRPLVDRIEAEIALADVVLVPSRLVARQMTEHDVPPAKLLTVPYGVGTWRGAPDGAGPPRRRRPRVICVGQISLRKGVPFLLRAVRGLDLDLVLVGNVFDRRILRNLPGNVTVTGSLAREELAREYRRADAFVMPTVEDSFGLVITEAVAAGLPVITTSAAGAAEVLEDTAARPWHRVVPPADTAALRAALRDVAPLPETRRDEISRSLSGSGRDGSWDGYARDVYAGLEAHVPARIGRP